MSEIKFSEDHEWILIDGGIGTVGLTESEAREMAYHYIRIRLKDKARPAACTRSPEPLLTPLQQPPGGGRGDGRGQRRRHVS